MELTLPDGTERSDQVLEVQGKKAIVQVLKASRALMPKPLELNSLGTCSESLWARICWVESLTGLEKPLKVFAEDYLDIQGEPLFLLFISGDIPCILKKNPPIRYSKKDNQGPWSCGQFSRIYQHLENASFLFVGSLDPLSLPAD